MDARRRDGKLLNRFRRPMPAQIIFVPRMANPVGRGNASEQRLNERSNSAATDIHSRSKEIRKRSSHQCAVRGSGRSVARYISHHSEPAVGVVLELAAAVSVVAGRRWETGHIGVYIEPYVGVTAISLKCRRLVLGLERYCDSEKRKWQENDKRLFYLHSLFTNDPWLHVLQGDSRARPNPFSSLKVRSIRMYLCVSTLLPTCFT